MSGTNKNNSPINKIAGTNNNGPKTRPTFTRRGNGVPNKPCKPCNPQSKK